MRKTFTGMIMFLSVLYILSAGLAEDNVTELLQQAQSYFEEHSYRPALKAFLMAYESDPRGTRAGESLYKAAFCLFKLNEYTDAVSRYEQVIKQFPGTYWAVKSHHGLANLYYTQNRWGNQDAIKTHFLKAKQLYAQLNPEKVKTDLINLYFEESEFLWSLDPKVALEDLHAILALNPDDESLARAHFLTGRYLVPRFLEGKPEGYDAVRSLETVIEEFSDTEVADDALFELARLYERNLNYGLALDNYRQLVRKYPRSAFAEQARRNISQIADPAFTLGINRLYVPGEKVEISVSSRNISSLQFFVYRIDLIAAFKEMKDFQTLTDYRVTSSDMVLNWEYDTGDEGNHIPMDYVVETALEKPGAYIVRAEGSGVSRKVLVLISGLSLVSKWSSDSLLVHVSDGMSGEPVDGCQLVIGSQYKQDRSSGDPRLRKNYFHRIVDGVTDGSGMYLQQITKVDAGSGIVLARHGDEYAVSQGYLSSWSSQASEPKLYFYTDRPVYRPGQKLSFKGILRTRSGNVHELPPQTQLLVIIQNPKNEKILEKKLTTNEYGSFNGEYELKEDAPLGAYNVTIREEQRYIGYYQFQVEEYKKPEFKVTVSTGKDQYRLGEEVSVTVQADYYFGEPVRNAAMSYTVKQSRYYPWFRRETRYDWLRSESGYDMPWMHRYETVVAEGKAFTDEHGMALIKFRASKSPDNDSTNNYMFTIEARVTDSSRREIIGNKQLIVTEKAFFVYLHPERYIYSPDDLVKIEINTQTPNNQPVACEGHIQVEKAEYDKDAAQYDYIPVTKQFIRIDEGGKHVFETHLVDEGYYRIRLVTMDEYEEEISGECWVWVATNRFKGTFYRYSGVQIVADRDMYQPGDTAHLLINTEFPSSQVLLTVEGTMLYQYELEHLTGHSMQVAIPIKKSFTPNVFINALVIQGFKVYQTSIEILVPPAENFLDIQIVPDKDVYAPRESCRMKVFVKDSEGKPVRMEFSLGIIDASLYYFRQDQTPDIQQFFYGQKQYNQVRTTSSFDFYFGDRGDAFKGKRHFRGGAEVMLDEMDMAAREMPAATEEKMESLVQPVIRKDFPDTVYWAPVVFTDANGFAEVEFPFPDTLTTWRATVRGITKDTRVGSDTNDVITRKNLIVRLQTPRFLTQRDSVTISSITHNYLGSDKIVHNMIEASGVLLDGADRYKDRIPPGGEKRFDYLFNVFNPGEATFTTKALTDEESDAMQVTIPILPHGVRKQLTENGSVENSIMLPIDPGEEFDPESFSCTLTLSPSIAAAIFPALEYLAAYPYGCVEQTMSRFLPTAITAKTVSDMGIYNQSLEKNLPDMMEKGLARLYEFQHTDGGWGWWKYDSSDPYMSAYVVFGLTLAQRADYVINQTVLYNGKKYLKNRVDYLEDRLPVLNYVLYALSFSNEVPAGALDKVFEQRDDLNDYQRALLAMTLYNTGDITRGKIMLRNMMDFARIDKESGTCSWGRNSGYYRWYDDGVEATAVALQAFVHLDPDNPVVQQTMKWLVMNRRGARWKSTRDTAMAVYALCDYLDKTGELNPDYTVKIYLDNKKLKEFNVVSGVLPKSLQELDIPLSYLKNGKGNLRIEKSGAGKLYYGITVSFFTLAEDIRGAGNDLIVQRTYYRLIPHLSSDRREEYQKVPLTSGDTLKSGDRIQVELKITAKNNFEYLVFEDPKPAGMEAVSLTSGNTYANGFCSNLELRDEKVCFFVGYLSQGEHMITYELRAEIPGVFHGMPTQAYSMYVPELNGISDEFRISIAD